MRLTKENIDKYLNKFGDLNLSADTEITHIDYIADNIRYINIDNSNVKEITCELPEGLFILRCFNTKLTSLPLLPKSLITFYSEDSKLPKEFKVQIFYDNVKCDRLRKLQMINSI